MSIVQLCWYFFLKNNNYCIQLNFSTRFFCFSPQGNIFGKMKGVGGSCFFLVVGPLFYLFLSSWCIDLIYMDLDLRNYLFEIKTI
jgi:hypothetical protein